jgi:hypothetical protein
VTSAIAKVVSLKINSDVDFFTTLVSQLSKIYIPDTIKRSLLLSIAAMPANQLNNLRKNLENDGGKMIFDLLASMRKNGQNLYNNGSELLTNLSMLYKILFPPSNTLVDVSSYSSTAQKLINSVGTAINSIVISGPKYDLSGPKYDLSGPKYDLSGQTYNSYDGAKVYVAGDKIKWIDNKIYEFNMTTGKAGINPLKNPEAWTMASSGGYRKKSRKAKKSRKSKRTHRR